MITNGTEVMVVANTCAKNRTGFARWVDSHLYVITKSNRTMGPFTENEVVKFNVLGGKHEQCKTDAGNC